MSSIAKVTTIIFNNIRTGTAMAPTATTCCKSLSGIRASLFSSLSNNPKDPNLVDDIHEGEGVFRFDPSEGEPEMTPTNIPKNDHTATNIPKNNTAGYNREQQYTNDARRRNKDTTRGTTMGDMAKAGTVKAMETGINMGDMAKQTLDNIWDTAKETTHKIKEAVEGKEEEEKKGYDIPPTDGRVDELRKKAGGYDLRNQNHHPHS